MPVTTNRGSKSSRAGGGDKMRSQVSPLVLGIIIVLGVGALGAAGFYVINGGWQTESQKQYQFQHETAPLIAARRGRPELLEEENAKRKAAGQPLLRAEERQQRAGNVKLKLQDLQNKMGGGQPSGQ